MTTLIDLVIKSPSATASDFRLKINISATISELKQAISVEYPSKPASSQQKLIFAGKLLRDEQIISEVLAQYDVSFPQTFHLVVSKQAPQTPVTPNVFQNINNQPLPNNGFQQFQNAQFFRNQPAINPAFERRERNEFSNGLFLFIKLVFLVYLFSSGGNAPRTIFLALGALFIFLFQTGALTFLFNGNNAPRNANNQDNQNNGRNGIFGEINALVFPFFYSLFPNWTPNANMNVNVPVQNQPQVQVPNINAPQNPNPNNFDLEPEPQFAQ